MGDERSGVRPQLRIYAAVVSTEEIDWVSKSLSELDRNNRHGKGHIRVAMQSATDSQKALMIVAGSGDDLSSSQLRTPLLIGEELRLTQDQLVQGMANERLQVVTPEPRLLDFRFRSTVGTGEVLHEMNRAVIEYTRNQSRSSP